VQEYAEKFTSSEDDLLQEINDWTQKNSSGYTMLSGHLQGKLLEMTSCMIRPKRILEIGTFMGYSALCLAKGLTEDGQLHTLEMNEKDAEKARLFFNKSSLRHKIILHTGNALKLIPELKETWDLVFIDADKPGYIEYFNLVLPQVRKNGFILADNIFFTEKSLKTRQAIFQTIRRDKGKTEKRSGHSTNLLRTEPTLIK